MHIFVIILAIITILGILMIIHGCVVKELPGYLEVSFGITVVFFCVIIGWIGICGFVPYSEQRITISASEYSTIKKEDHVAFILDDNMSQTVITDKYKYVSHPETATVVLVKNRDLYGFYLNEHLEVQ